MLNNQSEKDFDLTCWYLNLRRIIELTGRFYDFHTGNNFNSLSEIKDDQIRKLSIIAQAKDALLQWTKQQQPPTLGQLILSNIASTGSLFTHYSNFYCRGLGNYKESPDSRNLYTPLPEIYSKVDDLSQGLTLRFEYHPEHLTSHSAWTTLSGQRQLFVLGVIDNISNESIKAFPYIIGTLVNFANNPSVKQIHWKSRLEVFVDEIDSFKLVRNQQVPSKNEIEMLRNIPEEEIKKAFAEIIGEPTVPKDWGGEQSDLFSTHVKINEQRISTAFAFKGKAKFKPMTMAELGKNGDQIHRLFTEPADLLILQHCHEITPPVRGAMRAYASVIGNPRLFTLVNGYDTIRVLRAYQKCGL